MVFFFVFFLGKKVFLSYFSFGITSHGLAGSKRVPGYFPVEVPCRPRIICLNKSSPLFSPAFHSTRLSGYTEGCPSIPGLKRHSKHPGTCVPGVLCHRQTKVTNLPVGMRVLNTERKATVKAVAVSARAFLLLSLQAPGLCWKIRRATKEQVF